LEIAVNPELSRLLISTSTSAAQRSQDPKREKFVPLSDASDWKGKYMIPCQEINTLIDMPLSDVWSDRHSLEFTECPELFISSATSYLDEMEQLHDCLLSAAG